MGVHRIRLHGPWQIRPHHSDTPAFAMTIPGTLREGGLGDYTGRVSLHRRFGKPTHLDASEFVWLTFDEIRGLQSVKLNGVQLSSAGERIEFEVTRLLQDRNEIEVVLLAEDETCGIVGCVILEIRF